jgi:hypothetical protein
MLIAKGGIYVCTIVALKILMMVAWSTFYSVIGSALFTHCAMIIAEVSHFF